MFNTREYPNDPCNRSVVFFLESVVPDGNRVRTNYMRHIVGNCSKTNALQSLEQIRVFSQKLHYDIGQLKAPRRECCDITPSFDKTMADQVLLETWGDCIAALISWLEFPTVDHKLKAPHCECCDITPSFDRSMVIDIRHAELMN
ncbi:hypothetical protein F0562_010997 [Nyssa sinensis]|uniref:Uncharacterized protein n=1 Tax=Nyssa sinensis TaxID=561372 RepID=A0A5J5A2Z2_9ASTE|nr:hypothetical protein F0562_010997 [Nyssa sinensis]